MRTFSAPTMGPSSSASSGFYSSLGSGGGGGWFMREDEVSCGYRLLVCHGRVFCGLFVGRAEKKIVYIACDLSESKLVKIQVAKTQSQYQITDSDYEFANSWDDPYFGPYFAKIRIAKTHY
jgi:hypothetical protein